MSQSLFTSITGMTASQSKIDVVANNIANMNTTAFKSSNLTFSDLYSKTLSAGSSPTTGVGGTNPMQVGLGVGLAGITTDFTGGSIQSTGNSNDLNIQGNGWFTILNTDGSMGLTRDGSFKLDENGNLVTQAGLKVLGTNSAYSATGSTTSIFVPNKLNLVTSGKDLTAGAAGVLTNLNNASITPGSFSFDVYSDAGTLISTVNVDANTATSLQDIATAINTAIGADPNLTSGGNSIVTAKVNSDGTFTIETQNVGGLGNVGEIDFSTTGDTSNFLYESDLATSTFENGKYTSKILAYQADIGPATNNNSTVSKASYAVTSNGAIEVTYSNGDTITVEEKNGNMVLKYITSDGKTISSTDINVSGDVISAANLQLQLASVLNEQGLMSQGGNVYTTGPNSGTLTFSIGNANGYGQIGSGGLESSNVNLAIEFANMIVAQRAIDANSRVFTSTSEVLQRLVSLQ